jgi:stage II sporulation protein R
LRYRYFFLTAFLLIGWFGLFYFDEPTGMVAGDQNIIRLHVKANSNSESDQGIKMEVRDAVVNYLTPKLQQVSTPDEARKVIVENNQALQQLADRVIRECGATYHSELQIGHYEFPTKAYGTMVLPAGRYEAVRILLGTGEGNNWWCVLFPPLCFLDVPEMPKESPPQSQTIQFRWKLAELWEKAQQ